MRQTINSVHHNCHIMNLRIVASLQTRICKHEYFRGVLYICIGAFPLCIIIIIIIIIIVVVTVLSIKLNVCFQSTQHLITRASSSSNHACLLRMLSAPLRCTYCN
jgi:uncharacterized membrane protein